MGLRGVCVDVKLDTGFGLVVALGAGHCARIGFVSSRAKLGTVEEGLDAGLLPFLWLGLKVDWELDLYPRTHPPCLPVFSTTFQRVSKLLSHNIFCSFLFPYLGVGAVSAIPLASLFPCSWKL